MAKSDELVKYITQRIATYLETPREERRQRRRERKAMPREALSVRLFGMVPLGIRMMVKRNKQKN